MRIITHKKHNLHITNMLTVHKHTQICPNYALFIITEEAFFIHTEEYNLEDWL